MKQVLVLLMLCLVASAASGDTFELADPAAEILEEQNNPEAQGLSEVDYEEIDIDWMSGGFGDIACAEHISLKQDDKQAYQANLHWLQGFIDGVRYQRFITLGDNRLSPDYNPDLMALWIEQHCQENSPSSLDQAARAYLFEISG